jgi:hypothetical protein
MAIIQNLTVLRCFMAKTCISLFFFASASKSEQSLITAYTVKTATCVTCAVKTNRIQREFLLNDAIASQEFSPASKHSRQKTNFLKQILVLLPSPSTSLRVQWGRRAVTSRRRIGVGSSSRNAAHPKLCSHG